MLLDDEESSLPSLFPRPPLSRLACHVCFSERDGSSYPRRPSRRTCISAGPLDSFAPAPPDAVARCPPKFPPNRTIEPTRLHQETMLATPRQTEKTFHDFHGGVFCHLSFCATPGLSFCAPSQKNFFFNTTALSLEMPSAIQNNSECSWWCCFLHVSGESLELLDDRHEPVRDAFASSPRPVAGVRVRSPLFAAAPTRRPTPSASAPFAPTVGKAQGRTIVSREESRRRCIEGCHRFLPPPPLPRNGFRGYPRFIGL